MKKFSKILSVALLVALVLSLGVANAFADDAAQTGLKISIASEVTGHTYKAYEIFQGDIDTNDASSGKKLSNIEWGTGVNSDGIITDLYKITAVKTAMENKVAEINAGKAEGAEDITFNDLTAAQVAECLSGLTSADDLRAMAKAFADNKGDAVGKDSTAVSGGYEITGLNSGYYVVVDTSSTATSNDAYSALIVNLVGNTSVQAKVAKPTVDKDVQDEAADKDKNSTDPNGWGKTADHAINETFAFRLTANLPADTDFDAYDTYKVVFTDTMSAGVAYENIVSVTVDGITVSGYTLSSNVAGAKTPVGGAGEETTWSLTINDIKTIDGVDLNDGADVVVVYNAHLTEKAFVTPIGGTTTTNENKVKLTYSNNPTTGGTGDTTEKKVYVFTFEVDNTKYKNAVAEENVLAGAEFTLYKEDGTTVVPLIYDSTISAYRPTKAAETATAMVSSNETGKVGTFNIKGLDAGKYVLKETKTPDGFNTCDPINITVSAVHEIDTNGTPKVTLTNTNDNNAIINKSGTVLPSTGGIGTTIFYVVGGVLVLAAIILLVTKKRMSE